jgi:hypothetical protein
MTSDPFAAAQVAGNTATPDAFTASHDAADPFAVSTDYKGGDFTPAVPLDNLQDRLVVMIPRSLDPNAKDPFDPTGQKTREQYTVDLYVLSGGKLSYYYTQRADAEKGLPEETKEMIIEDISVTNPGVWRNYWVPQGAIIGKLKQAHANGRPFLGVVAMIPTKADRARGVTAQQIREIVHAWVARNRQGARPQYTWVLEDPTPEQRATAVTWWQANKDTIPPITPATAG